MKKQETKEHKAIWQKLCLTCACLIVLPTCLIKVIEGLWFPLLMAFCIFEISFHYLYGGNE